MYCLFQDIFGLASNSTVDRYKGDILKHGPGWLPSAFDKGSNIYDGLVVAAHDEARCLRMLQPFLDSTSEEVILIGDSWSPSIAQWPTKDTMKIPRKGKG